MNSERFNKTRGISLYHHSAGPHPSGRGKLRYYWPSKESKLLYFIEVWRNYIIVGVFAMLLIILTVLIIRKTAKLKRQAQWQNYDNRRRSSRRRRGRSESTMSISYSPNLPAIDLPDDDDDSSLDPGQRPYIISDESGNEEHWYRDLAYYYYEPRRMMQDPYYGERRATMPVLLAGSSRYQNVSSATRICIRNILMDEQMTRSTDVKGHPRDALPSYDALELPSYNQAIETCHV